MKPIYTTIWAKRPFKITLYSFSAFVILTLANPAKADLVLETETARLGTKGTGTVGNAVQFEHNKDGSTWLSLTAIEYAPTDRFEILLEPFFYEKQMPKDGEKVEGLGDTELTLSYLLSEETRLMPAFVVAGKVKAPTGQTPDISTGKYDYTGYLIFGKNIGGVDFNANLAYESFGSKPDEKINNQVIYALSADRNLTEDLSVYAEIFGNTKPSDTDPASFAGALATEYRLTKHVNAFVSVGYDTDNTETVRSGIKLYMVA